MKAQTALLRSLSSNSGFLMRYKKLIDESQIIESVLPNTKSFPVFHPYSSENTKFDVEALHSGFTVPTNDLIQRPGKMWRPSLLLMMAECLGVNINDTKSNRPIYFTTALCELIHSASLILDDIEDNSLKRRGEPCIHIKYGLDTGVNSGSLLYFKPLSMISNEIKNSAEYYKICMEELSRMHIGQCMDIVWHNSHQMPSEENYLYMVANKTGVIPRLGLRLLKNVINCSNSDPICLLMGKFGENIGAAFQIVDDFLNIQDCTLSQSKGMVGEDIKEGKRSLMVIHCYKNLKSEAEKKRLIDILALNTDDINIIMEAIHLLQSTNSIEYSKNMALNILNTTWKSIDPYLNNCLGKTHLKQLLDFLIDRLV